MSTLHWRNLSHNILHGISGHATQGEITAVLGSSGCGKTTLLNTIYTSRELNQDVTLNNTALTKKNVSYVFQTEHFMETLTVYETLEFNCRMRSKTKEDMLNIIANVKFNSLLDQRVHTLSGGEKKRLAIAIELSNDSQVFLLDEPTTSLDSHLASEIIDVLHTLKHRCIIVCTIHQPSLNTFMSFENVYMMNKGDVYYHGPASSIVDYGIKHGLKCPMYTNPAEFFISMISQEKLQPIQYTHDNDTTVTQQSETKTKRLYIMLEYWYLLKRSFRDSFRQHIVTKSRIIQSIIFGIIVGSLFYNVGNDQTDVQNKNGCVFFILVNQMMSLFFSVIQTFPLQLRTFKQEYDKRLYRVGPYYWAKTTADIPIQICVLCIFSAIVLPLTNVCNEYTKALSFLGFLILTSNVFASFGYCVSTLANDPTVVLIIGNILILPAMLVGGFFINNASVPNYYVVLENISTFNYAFQALMKCVYTDTVFNCESPTCVYETGEDVLDYLQVELRFIDYVYILLGQSIFLRILGHFVLYVRFKAIPTCKSCVNTGRNSISCLLSLFRYTTRGA